MAKKNKEPGRMRQLWRVYKVTAKNDPSSVWAALLGFLLTVSAGVTIGYLLGSGEPWSFTLWTITGLTSGLLVAMIIMSKRAERSAYKQIEGQPGAVSAVLNSQIKRSWRANPTPVAINPKSREAVYRMIGKPGVVLIGEGDSSRVTQMLQDEARKIQKIAPGVTIHQLKVTTDDSGVRIYNLLKTVYRLKRSLNRAEVTAVGNRIESLGGFSMPIPKGIDPMRVRPPKRKA